MAGVEDYHNRQLIPRWRKFEESARRRELDPSVLSRDFRFSEETIASRLEDWKKSPTLAIASDLVGVAFYLGLERLVVDAAQFIISQGRVSAAPALKIAAMSLRSLGIAPSFEEQDEILPDVVINSDRPLSSSERAFAIDIHRTKARLAEFPHNPLLWTNLSFLYTSLGQPLQADRAMTVALGLAKNNRYVLRAASRLFLHEGEKERAHSLLARSERLVSDPWLLAAEIALAATRNRSSKNIREARKILNAERHSSFHLSELASTLGTLEAREGNRRGGQKLIAKSLRDPSENAVAQAAWLSRLHLLTPASRMDLSPSAEAIAWQAWKSGEWDKAIEEANNWKCDQPFSAEPNLLAAHVSSVILADYPQAIHYLEEGRRTNPHSFTVMNNLAFSLAQNDDFEKAVSVLERIELDGLSEANKVVLSATTGLIAFRGGALEQGRELYLQAIEKAKPLKDWRKAVAEMYLAFEMLRAHMPGAEEMREKALEDAAKTEELWCRALANRLRKYKILGGDP